METPRLVPFAKAPCLCVRNHTPMPEYAEMHHVHPQGDQLAAWGEVRDKERVPLCPTSHRAVHLFINAVLARRRPPKVNAHVRQVAMTGVGRILIGRATR